MNHAADHSNGIWDQIMVKMKKNTQIKHNVFVFTLTLRFGHDINILNDLKLLVMDHGFTTWSKKHHFFFQKRFVKLSLNHMVTSLIFLILTKPTVGASSKNQGGGALCVQMDFTRTFEANTKCNNMKYVWSHFYQIFRCIKTHIKGVYLAFFGIFMLLEISVSKILLHRRLWYFKTTKIW